MRIHRPGAPRGDPRLWDSVREIGHAPGVSSSSLPSAYFSEPWLKRVEARVNGDPELQVIGDWFTTAFSLTCGDTRWILRFERGKIVEIVQSPRLDVRCAFGFRASPEIWARFFAKVPEPLYHDFFAMLMRVPGFVLEGDTLVAMQNARALHRAMNVLRTVPGRFTDEGYSAEDAEAQTRPDHDTPAARSSATEMEPVVGRYLNLDIAGVRHRLYFEEAGQGVPLLCLHTAGADSRQYRHLLNDPAVTARYRVIAFDMPFHGRSNPPDGWWLHKYLLKTDDYLDIIRAVWKALDLTRPVVMGCSMGGAIALKIAAGYQKELRGIIGLESSAYAPGRENDFLHHPAVHGGELVASYTYGLCAPASPEASARENWWYYGQSGPGVYAGDVHYYSVDWDGREDIKRIDSSVCKVSLLTGAYDYSCTPDMTRAVARSIPGSRLVIMEGMGHFPMIENYPVFREFLLPELDYMADDSAPASSPSL
jgi:pimeloyl-ACP methyl ester carboxylesterase